MTLSVFDMFSIGIGPSSSHTVGPMRAALMFAESLAAEGHSSRAVRIGAELFGSLGATGRGHGSDQAVILGLCGARPETVDTDAAPDMVEAVRSQRRLRLPGGVEIAFDETTDLVLNGRESLPGHPNGMRFRAYDDANVVLAERVYYSVGGGFVHDESAAPASTAARIVPYPFRTADDLLAHCRENDLSMSAVMRANERVGRGDAEIDAGLLRIWQVMADCVRRGCERDGVLPGGLFVPRRAKTLYDKLIGEQPGDPLVAMDWVSLYAMAVNEENAAGGRVVTAPTNGAAGILPAVLHYYRHFVPGADDAGTVRFLLTAGAIGVVLKETGSISGAEVGCQGEVGSACAMAAAGLTEVLGGTPQQVENAAEIGLEHHLGLTCDPIGGLVQIPCIERNAVAAVQAINAARIALRGNGIHVVSLDKAIKTMRATGADMSDKYKETSRGGLAVNVIEC
ncbi:L-serine ammonia-lyase [Nocardia sp. NPDC051570]|uniref:L-serine ammonia-lyase n=1 Tax=Nocardia sp. NPDC051570 TaxID=3364324 RepID=UPI0037B2F2BD